MTKSLWILDSVLHDIDEQVAAFAPERGGALLALPDRPVIVRFLLDEDAETTGVSFRPSRRLNRRVQALEADEDVQYAGLLHLHPAGLDRPSVQDERELAIGLALNPHLPGYLAPIVTHGRDDELGEHELPLTDAKVSFFIARRARNGGVIVRPQPVAVIPLHADLERAATVLAAEMTAPITMTELDAAPFFVGQLALRDGCELIVLADEHYPATPPLVLLTRPTGAVAQRDVPWRLELPPDTRLLHALESVLRAAATPPAAGSCLDSMEHQRTAVRTGLFARSTGLLSESVASKTALIAGLGSVGSQAAEGLARAGVGRLVLIDPDTVEPANLSRSVYAAADLGRPKADALRDRLLAINPGLTVESITANLLDLDPTALDQLVRQAALVVAATDDPGAQRALNRFAYGRGKPALFIGLYAGAQGGEVVISMPGHTACYLCATFARHAVEAETSAVQPGIDYGTGRLPGEVALGADIQHVVSVATKLALALLVRGEAGALGQFLEPVLAEGSSYLTLGMVPNYWFYPDVFGTTIGQFAYQSVWLTPTRRAACPVCGDTPVDPCSVPLRAPPLASLRQRRPPSRGG